MRRPVHTGVAGGALLLAVATTALANPPFLPKRAHYRGPVEGGGTLDFKVRNHKIRFVAGSLPVRAHGTCQFAKDGAIPLRLYQYQPVGNGPFKITASQHATNKQNNWRSLRLHVNGQFDPSASRAQGTLRARLHDSDGVCRTRKLSWRVRRR